MTTERIVPNDPTAQMDHLVRALSHDMNANFMVLENSVAELKRSCGAALPSKLTSGFDHVEACLRESKRFLDDLVMLGKTGAIEMQPASVDVSQVLAEVTYEQEALLAERGIDVCVSENLPAVRCNRSRLKQVFTNLVRNAARHGCAAVKPRITVSCDETLDDRQTQCGWGRAEGEPPGQRSSEESNRHRQQDDAFVHVRVHDNGPGIDPAYYADVFMPGRQAPGGAEDGSGMGLAIVKKIVEHYGGRAWIDPACTIGTAVVISLPKATNQPTSAANAGNKAGVPHDDHESGIRGPHRNTRPIKRRRSVT